MGAQKTPPCEGQGFFKLKPLRGYRSSFIIHPPSPLRGTALPAQHEGKSAKAEQCG